LIDKAPGALARRGQIILNIEIEFLLFHLLAHP
jgi:hypothetical protein